MFVKYASEGFYFFYFSLQTPIQILHYDVFKVGLLKLICLFLSVFN